jgi:hypothetical protein
LAALLAAGALSACGTASQSRIQAISQTTAAANEEMRNCTEAIYNAADFAPAKRRLPLDYALATLEQETSPGMANDVEIATVLQAHPKLQVCRKNFLDKLGKDTPSLVSTYATVLTLSEGSLAEVLQKKKSWGDHVRDVKEMMRRVKLDIEDDTKKAAEGLSQDAKAVQARQLETDKALALYAQMEKSFGAIRRPVFVK